MIRAALSLLFATAFVVVSALWMVRDLDLARAVRALADPRLRTVELEELLSALPDLGGEAAPPTRAPAQVALPEPRAPETGVAAVQPAAPESPVASTVELGAPESPVASTVELGAPESPVASTVEPPASESPDPGPDRAEPPRDQDRWAALIRRMLALHRRGQGAP